MNRYTSARLARLEHRLRPSRCPACGDYPARILYVDGGTDAVISESMPETGCPTCGREVWREVRIVFDPEVVSNA